MKHDLVTIISTTRDEDTGAQKVVVQLNDSGVVGQDHAPPGENATLEVPANDNAYNAVKAAYPSAAIHSTESLNALVEKRLIDSGARIKLVSGELITPAEAERRNELAREAEASKPKEEVVEE